MNQGDLLCKHANIDGIAPKIPIGVDTKSVVSAANQRDVTLDANIGSKHLRPGVVGIGAVAPGAAAVNTSKAALPGHRGAARREVPADAGRHRVKLTAHVGV